MEQSETLTRTDERLPGGVAKPIGAPTRSDRKMRNWWIKQFRTWHWISAAVSLGAIMLFAITGVTLNHASTISAKPQTTQRAATLPPPLLAMLGKTPAADAPLPAPVAAELKSLVGLNPAGRAAEWSPDEVYVAMPGPGRDSWVSVNRATGAVTSEVTDRGWISYINDLHKGRNTGAVWFWFIDIFAAACIVFSITGLLLLQLHARHRPVTWPLVGLSVGIPVLIAILLIH